MYLFRLKCGQSDSDDHSENSGECPECGGRGNKPKKQNKTLRDLSEAQTLKEFSKCVNEEFFASRYCCGGTLANVPKAGPNTMRWDDTSDNNIKSRMILHGLPLKAIEVLSCMSFLPLQES